MNTLIEDLCAQFIRSLMYLPSQVVLTKMDVDKMKAKNLDRCLSLDGTLLVAVGDAHKGWKVEQRLTFLGSLQHLRDGHVISVRCKLWRRIQCYPGLSEVKFVNKFVNSSMGKSSVRQWEDIT